MLIHISGVCVSKAFRTRDDDNLWAGHVGTQIYFEVPIIWKHPEYSGCPFGVDYEQDRIRELKLFRASSAASRKDSGVTDWLGHVLYTCECVTDLHVFEAISFVARRG